MASVNKVILLGRLGADPDLKQTQGGMSVCRLSIATDESRKGPDGNYQKETTWHRVSCFGKVADNAAKYLAKGREVFIEGRIAVNSWQDRDTGEKKFSTEIIASNIQFIGGNPNAQSGERQQRPQNQYQAGGYHEDTSIPF